MGETIERVIGGIASGAAAAAGHFGTLGMSVVIDDFEVEVAVHGDDAAPSVEAVVVMRLRPQPT